VSCQIASTFDIFLPQFISASLRQNFFPFPAEVINIFMPPIIILTMLFDPLSADSFGRKKTITQKGKNV
jgi:hypothetical protein